MKYTNNPYKTAEAMKAAAVSTELGEDWLRALFSMTMRGVEVEGRTAKAWLTAWRYLELTKEDDGGVSAWVVGLIEIAGKLTATCVFLGEVEDATQVVRVVRQAKIVIAEAIETGSRGFPFDGEATGPRGERTFIYKLRSLRITTEQIAKRVDSWLGRNQVTMVAKKKAKKAA